MGQEKGEGKPKRGVQGSIYLSQAAPPLPSLRVAPRGGPADLIFERHVSSPIRSRRLLSARPHPLPLGDPAHSVSGSLSTVTVDGHSTGGFRGVGGRGSRMRGRSRCPNGALVPGRASCAHCAGGICAVAHGVWKRTLICRNGGMPCLSTPSQFGPVGPSACAV